MNAKRKIMRILEVLKLKSLALQVYDKTIFSNLYNPDNRKYVKFPLPPIEMMHLVGTSDIQKYIWGGRLTITRMLDLIASNKIDLGFAQNILDFGCGCGRLTMYLLHLFGGKNIWGSDINSKFINWCNTNLSPGKFQVNNSSPPLKYGDNKFDIIISYSVFTHLTEESGISWLKELSRTLMPEGVLIFSSHGYLDIYDDPNVTSEQLVKYKKGEIVSISCNHDYLNDKYFDTYHPPESIEKLCKTTNFKLLNTFPALKAPPLLCAGHNLHLLQKESF